MKKISVISGGSGGLGLAIAELLIKKGRDVLILGRDNDRLTAAAKKLNRLSKSSQVHSLVCNVGNEQDVYNAGSFITGNRLVVEYLFNNAGRGLFAPVTEITSGDIDAVFEAGLKGLILLTSEILKITPEKEELTIVNIMSTSSLLGRDQETVYCAAKWGARGFTEALRTELAGKNRNIIAVYPGGMKTGFYKVTGQDRDISGFMEAKDVAAKIVNAVVSKERLVVTDLTISRKKH